MKQGDAMPCSFRSVALASGTNVILHVMLPDSQGGLSLLVSDFKGDSWASSVSQASIEKKVQRSFNVLLFYDMVLPSQSVL